LYLYDSAGDEEQSYWGMAQVGKALRQVLVLSLSLSCALQPTT
jgi:hypothetical protein